MANFVVFKSKKNGDWYWHLKGDNGEVMAQSEGYTRRWDARRGAKRFASLAANADILTQEK